MKVSRSLKLMRGAAMRTRKLARDMLVFWKRVDKEMVLFFSLYCIHLMSLKLNKLSVCAILLSGLRFLTPGRKSDVSSTYICLILKRPMNKTKLRKF